jgi:hypothetical protein
MTTNGVIAIAASTSFATLQADSVAKLTVQDLQPKDQQVFVRVDFNVPLEPSPEGPRI